MQQLHAESGKSLNSQQTLQSKNPVKQSWKVTQKIRTGEPEWSTNIVNNDNQITVDDANQVAETCNDSYLKYLQALKNASTCSHVQLMTLQ